jgi:hypothetical protein
VPLATRKCPKCGTEQPGDGLYCPNCGAARVAVATSDTGAVILMAVFGVLAALPAWFVLSLFGASLLSNVGVPKGSHQEFYVSWGATCFFIFLTLLAFAGLIVAARARISSPLRAFLIAFLCVTLGLFSICDIFAVSSQSPG